MARYTMKPITVDALQWTGDNLPSMRNFAGAGVRIDQHGQKLKLWAAGTVHTLHTGDWIVQGVEGEVYPCPGSVFAKTYERA